MRDNTFFDKTSGKSLERYIESTDLIQELSSPSIRDIAGADEYRTRLLQNFTRIGRLAQENIKILETAYFPLIRSDRQLDHAAVEELRHFSESLVNAYNLDHLDIPIVYLQAERLLHEASGSGDEEELIRALDGMVSAAYAMISMTGRLYPCSDVCFKYRDKGLDAAMRLLGYLEHEKFSALNDECREMVLVNARYIRVVSEIDNVPSTAEENARDLKWMLDALALYDDPFYRKELPSYNWNYHLFRTLEYIGSFTNMNNQRGFDKAQLDIINECTKRMAALYDTDEEYFSSIHWTEEMPLYLVRNAYLAGEIDLAAYRKGLEKINAEQVSKAEEGSITLVMLMTPLEYMLVLDHEQLSRQETRCLSRFYDRIILYMHRASKKEGLMSLATCLSLILKNFIELPGEMDFETMGLSLMAALHVPTYVHTLSTADFAVCLTRHLLRKDPSLFVGMPGYDDVEAVKAHAGAIGDFVYHAALCHDFGKLMIAETILTYGRDLFDDEFGYIRSHPEVGALLLEQFPETAQYAEVVRGHHRWFNGKGGYPDDFDMAASSFRTVTALITCADCLDAATDTVGRSYKEGKSLDQFITELHAGSGTRYAPYLTELLADREVRADIETLLAKGRDENYRSAYYILKKHEMR